MNTPIKRTHTPVVVTDSDCRTPLCFSPVTEADIPLINSLLQTAPSRTCDYTIGGIYMWVDYFKYEYCVLHDTLFIKGRTENRPAETAFMLPVGALPLNGAVELIAEYCRREGIRPVFSAVPVDRLDELLEAAGPDTEVEPLDDWADYLYDITSLATFAGKHMMRKRNHVNRFFSDNPHWVFEEITPANITEVLEFFENTPEGDKDTPEMMGMALYEHDQCRRVLRSQGVYPFESMLLRGESGAIVAIAVGEVIADTVYVHIEKMNHDEPGAGAAVCRLFAAHILRRHAAVRYVNREEDCGDPGLRASKESYRPSALLHKYNVRLMRR